MDHILSNAVRLQDKSAAFTATFNEQLENLQIVFDYVIINYVKIQTS